MPRKNDLTSEQTAPYRDTTFSLRMPRELRQALDAHARRERRSVGNLVEGILAQWVDARREGSHGERAA